eukprot:TRINITY_DN1016_c0_g1_i2.p1 TRINITY_DN1016_c0_g1~~TRINITY_DN1016_c0_g1_i2.p1  ORF type:complete len:285 (-),score=67.93 TRINITY_DN1016_c0_g1_i2:63-917(-)
MCIRDRVSTQSTWGNKIKSQPKQHISQKEKEMVDAGITTKDDCISQYQALKMSKTFRYIIYRIEGEKTVEVDSTGARDGTWADFIKSLPKDQPRYAVFDYLYKTNDTPPREVEKCLYVFWCPDDAPVKGKMIYASTNEKLKKQLVGVSKEIQAKGFDDLDVKSVEDLLRKQMEPHHSQTRVCSLVEFHARTSQQIQSQCKMLDCCSAIILALLLKVQISSSWLILCMGLQHIFSLHDFSRLSFAIYLSLFVDLYIWLSCQCYTCLLYTSPSPRDGLLSRMPSSA